MAILQSVSTIFDQILAVRSHIESKLILSTVWSDPACSFPVKGFEYFTSYKSKISPAAGFFREWSPNEELLI